MSDPLEQVVAVHGIASVRLPEIPTSGYEWALTDPPGDLRLVHDRYEELETGIAGGNGIHVFELALDGLRAVEATFALRRPWEQSAIERRRVIIRPG